LICCLRKAWFVKTTTAPEFVQANLYSLLGNIAIRILENSGAENVSELPVEAMELTGKMDVNRDSQAILDRPPFLH
jgi:hypothetical protein